MSVERLKRIEEKLDIVLEQTARQDERIKQNTKDIEGIKKKTWAAIGTALSAFFLAIISKLVI